MACLGEQTCKQLVRAISEQNGIMLFFAAVQGLRMNRDHFINPMNPDCTWPQVDYDDFLRPGMVQKLPGYLKAENTICGVLAKIASDEITEALIEYRSVMETAGMKLAHYYGYQFGNLIFPDCMPGFYEDAALLIGYNRMLETYFTKR